MIRRFRFDETDQIAERLAAGNVIGLPTDTVYGVGARLDRPDAIAKLFALKRRPLTVALPVLVARTSQLDSLDVELDDRFHAVANRFWPGALTVVVKASVALAAQVGSTSLTVGVRVPDDSALRTLLLMTGPLAVTSANEHGEPPCYDVEEVEALFDGRGLLDAVVDGGRRDGVISSVVDLSCSPWRVLRRGAIDERDLTEVLD